MRHTTSEVFFDITHSAQPWKYRNIWYILTLRWNSACNSNYKGTLEVLRIAGRQGLAAFETEQNDKFSTLRNLTEYVVIVMVLNFGKSISTFYFPFSTVYKILVKSKINAHCPWDLFSLYVSFSNFRPYNVTPDNLFLSNVVLFTFLCTPIICETTMASFLENFKSPNWQKKTYKTKRPILKRIRTICFALCCQVCYSPS